MVIKILLGFVGLLAGVAVAGLLALWQFGFALVTVEDERLYLPIPVPLAAMEAIPLILPDEDLRELRGDLAEFRPLLLAVLDAVEGAPDAVFLEVNSPEASVNVSTRSGELLVEVDPPGPEHVKVQVPVRGVRRLVAVLTD